MNEDEKFFTQFKEEPRPELVAAVYQRINQPMNAQTKSISMRQVALSFALVLALLLAALMVYPPTRVQAFHFLRQIGVFSITTEQSIRLQPTSSPPDPAQKPQTAATAAEASELAGFQVLSPVNIPDGYVVESAFNIHDTGNGKIVVTAFANPNKGTFILINQYRYGVDEAFIDNVAGQEMVQDVQVRGHAGVWIAGRLMTSPIDTGGPDQNSLRSSNWLRWEENGIVYTLISDDLALDEMLRLAQSFQ